MNGARRADIIIVSKSPNNLNQAEKKEMQKKLNLKANQKGYFSSIYYQKYKNINNNSTLKNEHDYSVTLVTGIANPYPLLKHLQEKVKKVKLIKFPDHHNYSIKDIKKILLAHKEDKSLKKLILTTEKDATKFKNLLNNFKQYNFYYIPIKTVVNDGEKFDKQILDYVTKD